MISSGTTLQLKNLNKPLIKDFFYEYFVITRVVALNVNIFMELHKNLLIICYSFYSSQILFKFRTSNYCGTKIEFGVALYRCDVIN